MQTYPQEYILPGYHSLLFEHFQSSDSKRKYDETADEFLCSKLLLRCSGQAELQDIMVTAGKEVYGERDIRGSQKMSGNVR